MAGSSRSGSIWTAGMLAAAPNSRCVVEPDNVNTGDHPANHAGSDFGPFPVLGRGQASSEYAALWEMAFTGRVPGRDGWTHPIGRMVLGLPHPLRDSLLSSSAALMGRIPGLAETIVVQTVMAHFAIEWIVDRFHPKVVVIQRDPLNMVSSWLEWDVHGFDIHTRPEVRERCAELGIELPAIGNSELSRTAWWIGLLTAALGAVVARHPDWVVVTHEVLCADPEPQFRQLYSTLGLTWSPEPERFLRDTGYHMPTRRTHRGHGPSRGDAASVRAQVAQKWRERLTDEQVAEANEVLSAFPTRGWVSPPAAVRAPQQAI